MRKKYCIVGHAGGSTNIKKKMTLKISLCISPTLRLDPGLSRSLIEIQFDLADVCVNNIEYFWGNESFNELIYETENNSCLTRD